MENVVKGVYYCQNERTEELNERYMDRLNPNRLMQSIIDPRSVPTRYVRMPIIDCNAPSKIPIRKVSEYSVYKDFNPGNNKSPYAGYANYIDNDSRLRNLFFPRQACAQNAYIPQSSSELYKYNINYNDEQQPFPELFRKETFNNYNPNSCNLGNDVFHNHTQQQLKNKKSINLKKRINVTKPISK